MFRLGQEKEGIFSQDETDSSSEDVAYFFDENAMVTIDTFYAMLKKIDTETSRIYLFGDYNQLPPIGKGLMFKNLLRFMPCVCLTVSKRAAEGSHITLNSNYINNNSDGTNWKYLESGDDFFLMTCSDESITTATALLVKHYLGKGTPEEEQRLCKPLHLDHLPKVDGLTPDDIQVVSPLSKVNYAWGSTRLNTMLQPLFNNNTGYRNTIINQKPKTDNYTRFLIGDRVIHSSKNMYSMQWYSSIDHGVCQKTYGYGICNGEVGKIVSYFHADSVEFSDEIGFEPEDFKYPDNMRDDSSYSGSDAWFVAVKYYDYLSDSNYYILYRTTENMINPSSQGKTLFGEDLDKLMLFYAGTTHKLQGSQAKLIISVLGDVNYKGFITRNMIYTTFTRGEKLVFGVGSVSNTAKSMLTKARQDVAGVNTLTIGEIL
jgi:ATP-dependent exoDNAse (exonuclease V) alpha subunit